jgi:protein ImuA
VALPVHGVAGWPVQAREAAPRWGDTADLFGLLNSLPAPPAGWHRAVQPPAQVAAPAWRPPAVATPAQVPEGMGSPPPAVPLEQLHPALWRAHQLGQPVGEGLATGFAALDAALPGGGWPRQALTELLLPQLGLGELRLLAPALAAVQAQQRCVMLFDPPALPFAAAWSACGLDALQLYVVRSRPPGPRQRHRATRPPRLAADLLWSLEQALKSGHVGAVLAWLPPQVPVDALRRLQLAAQAHDGPAWLLRDEACRQHASPAPLRLWLQPAGIDELRLQVLKRRGPPLAQPLRLALPAVLSAPEREHAQAWLWARQALRQAQAALA